MKYIITTIISMAVLTLPLVAQTDALDNNSEEVSYRIETLPFNTDGAEFAPAIYRNGIMFCKNNMPDYWTPAGQMRGNTDIYYTEKNIELGSYYKPHKLKGDINSNEQEGPFCVANNGKTIYYTKSRKILDKAEMWFIYVADLSYDKWDKIVGFYHNYKQYNIAHPALSNDGQYLFFSADIPGGFGGMDLYFCYKIGNTWSKPINLGTDINTPDDEIFPFFHADGTLYFSSNGLGGQGGFDIFYSRKNENGGWANPTNMKAPINSIQDDLGIVFSADKKYGYLSSARAGGAGSCDIYAVRTLSQDAAGIYARQDRPASGNFGKEKPKLVKVEVSPVSAGHSVLPVLFDAGKFDPQTGLLNDALGLGRIAFEPEDWHVPGQMTRNIERVVELMQQNPSLMVQINVHTDTRGNDDANKILSEKRAKEIERYMANMGIQNERMSAYGLGEKYPINRCLNGMNCPDGEHEMNNRVDFLKVGGQIGTQAQFVFSSQKAPVTGSQSAELNNSQKSYEVRVGPFDKIDSRTFYDYRNINRNIYLEETPKGKTIILGPYASYETANYERVRVQEKTAQKASVTVSTTRSAPTKDVANKFEIYAGPFSNISTDMFNKFKSFNPSAALRYHPKGTMIVWGKYDNLLQAQEQELAMREFLSKIFQKKAARKINTAVYTNMGKNISEPWLKLKKSRHKK